MKPMLDDEYRRYRIGVWSLDKILVTVPVCLFVTCLIKEIDYDFLILGVVVSFQNLLIYRITRSMK